MLIPLFDRNPTSRFPWLTVLLVVVNLGIHFWAQGLSEQETADLLVRHGLVPKRLSSIDAPNPVEVQIVARGEDNQGNPVERVIYETELSTDRSRVLGTLFTMMFLHGGWLHVISNVWMLWIFGNNIEDRLGPLVFIAFYLMGGVLACYCQWIIDPMSETPVVGASGAVWALLGGYAVTYPKAKVLTLLFVGIPFLLNIPALVIIALKFAADLIMGLAMLQDPAFQPIAHWAHVGGCIAGVVLMPLLGVGSSPPEADWRSEAKAMLNPATPPDENRFGTSQDG